MTREDEASKRKEAVERRLQSAENFRESGSKMMIAGGVALGIALTAFVLESRIQAWERGTALAVIGMLFVGGMGFYVGGTSMGRLLAQMADDRAEHEETQLRLAAVEGELIDARKEIAALRNAVDDVLFELRKNQILLSRLGAEGANKAAYQVQRSALPMAESASHNGHDVVDPKYLADMSEAVRLGEEIARRKLSQPPENLDGY